MTVTDKLTQNTQSIHFTHVCHRYLKRLSNSFSVKVELGDVVGCYG